MIKRLLKPLTLLALLLLAAGTVLAQQARIEIVGLQFIGCGSGAVEGRFSVAVYDANGVLTNAATPVTLRTTYVSDGVLAEFTNNLQSGAIVTFGINNPSGPITYVILQTALVSDPNVKSPGYFLDCATGQISTIGPSRDGRINYGAGDLLAALYMSSDSAGKPSIAVYQILNTREGDYIGAFDHALFAPFISAPPAVNTAIASVGPATLYALTSGEFQINIGPDAEGKIARVLFRSFPPTNIRLFPAAR